MTAVLGPGAHGVVVATPEPEAARADRVWLHSCGFAAATPDDLGLRMIRSAWAFDPDPRIVPAVEWARISRRPTVLTVDDETVQVEGPRGGRPVERAEAPEAIEAAAGEAPPPRVAVFGGAWIDEEDVDYASARTFGKELASRHVEVICGGYQGIMAAVCRGAADAARGAAFGVTVAAWATRAAVNEWIDHVVEARDLFARLPLLADAEAWVAFPGGVGTLKEVALCWNLVQNGLAEPRPLVVIGERWGRLVEAFREQLLVTEAGDFDLLTHADDAERALDLVAEAIG